MAYIRPSVLVYQELQNAGGVANVTPDLGTVIVGPLFNVVRVDPLSPTSVQSTLTRTITNIANDIGVIHIDKVASIIAEQIVEVPLFSPKPGQVVTQSTVVPHVSKAKVLAYSFDYSVGKTEADFNTGSRSKYVLSTSTGTGVSTIWTYALTNELPIGDPTQVMPDGLGQHIEVGYVAEVTYTDPDTSLVVTKVGTVTKVFVKTTDTSSVDYNANPGTSIKYITLSVKVPEFTATTAVTARVRVYKVYSYFKLTDIGSTFNFDDINHDNLRLNVTTTDSVKGFKCFKAVTTAPATLISPAIEGTTTSDYLMVAGQFSVAYKALRQDKYSTILTISDTAERASLVGEATDENPLGLGVQLALDNTTKQVFAVSLQFTSTPEFPAGQYLWSTALELLENFRAGYALIPLTQQESVLSQFKTHCVQMSTPERASWRTLICNTAIPVTKDIVAKATLTNTTGTGKVVGLNKYLQDLTETFVAKQVTPGDTLVVTASNLSTTIGSWTVDEVINDNTLAITGFSALAITGSTTFTYHIVRTLTRRQRAEEIAAKSVVFGSNRVWHVQPDLVGVSISGAVKFLPGYYLCAALGGITSGFPIQQGFTNISVAGIEDLSNSNFYFKRDELNLIAEAGTCLFVQDTQGGIPYCRHALTTDMTVLEYREILKVKNWDFLSYYFYDKLKGFIGTWNITPDTLSNMRQVLNASIELLKGQKLPKIGPPLLSGTIELLEQSAVNKDNINIRIKLEIVSPNNYTNLYLVI
jgi:hypothetical protein